MPELRIVLRRLSVLPLVISAACATAQTPQTPTAPAPTTAQAPAPLTGDTWAKSVLTPPEGAVRAASAVTLKGTELGTMWTFENAPLDYWKKTYGFTATPEWMEHVRLASLRLPGCSASFVSANGLILTNHHCARGCVAQNSTPENDYVEKGFYAKTAEEEKVCPGSYVDQLIATEDVTQQVRAAQAAGQTAAQATEAMQAKIQQITADCRQKTGNNCQVVTLYRGGQYQLYTYKRYAPLKLVMAPELQSGFFGGDYDNFVYPRYALDFAFLRAYEADGKTPVQSKHFFPFDPNGADEGEPIFVTGNPGSSARGITVAQLMYERAYRHPMQIQVYETNRRLIQEAMKTATPQQQIQLRESLFGVENSLKKYVGEMAGLRDTTLIATKIKWEQEFRAKARNTPAAAEYLDVWDKLYDVQVRKIQLNPALNVSNPSYMGGSLVSLPGQIMTYLRMSELPEAQRPPQMRNLNPAQLSGPVDATRARNLLEAHITMAVNWLPPGHALLGVLLRPGETPAQAAQRLVTDSKVGDPAVRQALVTGGLPALRASTDPVVQLALALDSLNRQIQPQWQALLAEEGIQTQRLARAMFAVYGTQLPPDATFTLRISDGVPTGYEYNGTIAPFKTTFHGMWARANEFGNKEPFNLPELFAARRNFVDMTKPMDFVSTNDITGGNSGSPVIDRDAKIIGLAFDGNMEQLPNEYVFRTETGGRTISVHSAGILEALKNIYQAQKLVNELLGAI